LLPAPRSGGRARSRLGNPPCRRRAAHRVAGARRGLGPAALPAGAPRPRGGSGDSTGRAGVIALAIETTTDRLSVAVRRSGGPARRRWRREDRGPLGGPARRAADSRRGEPPLRRGAPHAHRSAGRRGSTRRRGRLGAGLWPAGRGAGAVGGGAWTGATKSE